MRDLKKHIAYISQFATGQFLLQGLNVLNGFFLLRWLSIPEQAKFSVAFGIQSLILNLSDLGFTGSIIALVGTRIDDRKLIGGYINSAKRLRNYLFFFSCLVTIIILPFIIRKQSWGYGELVLILTPVLLAVFWQADCSLYDSTLVMQKKMKDLYKPQVGLAAFKLITNFVLHLSNIITAFSTLLLNAVVLLVNGKTFKRKAAPYIDMSPNDLHEHQFKEMINYLKPLFPSLVFNALNGQLQIFLISFFGKTNNIAEVAALGKLSQMFIFLGSINNMIVSPLIARATKENFLKKYILVLIGSFGIACLIYFVSLLIPNVLLFLLGPKYSNLKEALGFIVLTACVSYFAGTIWTMSSARKWLFWWGTLGYIGVMIVFQVAGIFLFDLSSTIGITKLSLLTACGVLSIHICIAVVGLVKDKLI